MHVKALMPYGIRLVYLISLAMASTVIQSSYHGVAVRRNALLKGIQISDDIENGIGVCFRLTVTEISAKLW